jgi:hypothetical protein
MNKKDAEADAVRASKASAHAMGKNNGMSGRDLFTFNPNLMNDDDDEDGEGEDEWDLTLLRIRKEKEDREAEIERCVCARRGRKKGRELTFLWASRRIRMLDSHFGGLGLGGVEEEEEDAAEKPGPS